MIWILFSWLIISIICYSFGNILLITFNFLSRSRTILSLTESIFIGLATISALVNLSSIFTPTNKRVLLVFIIISITYVCINYKRLLIKLKRELSLGKYYPLLISVLFIILLMTVYGRIHDDYGSYHLPVIKWLNAYGIVPGLGNLHSRYAFNSSLFNIEALFFNSRIFPNSFLINSFCYIYYSLWLIIKIKKTNNLYCIIAFLFLLIAPFFISSIGGEIGTTSTDIIPGLLTIYILTNLLTENNYLKNKCFTIMILSFLCVTLKLSYGIVGIASIFSIIYLLKEKEYRKCLSLICIAFIFIPWFIQNMILSGYLVYPIYEIDLFNFDWKMPISMIMDERAIIKSWTFIHHYPSNIVLNLSFAKWFPIWYRDQELFMKLLLFLLCLFPIGIGKYVTKKNLNINIFIAFFINSLGLIIFLNNPSLRFSFGFILVAISSFWFSCSKIIYNPSLKTIITISIIILLIFMPIVCFKIKKIKEPSYTYTSLLIKPQPRKFGANYYVKDVNGIKVGWCFDILPCAMYENEGLVFRGKTLHEGFRFQEGSQPIGGIPINTRTDIHIN